MRQLEDRRRRLRQNLNHAHFINKAFKFLWGTFEPERNEWKLKNFETCSDCSIKYLTGLHVDLVVCPHFVPSGKNLLVYKTSSRSSSWRVFCFCENERRLINLRFVFANLPIVGGATITSFASCA